jgi:hypothetical protein
MKPSSPSRWIACWVLACALAACGGGGGGGESSLAAGGAPSGGGGSSGTGGDTTTHPTGGNPDTGSSNDPGTGGSGGSGNAGAGDSNGGGNGGAPTAVIASVAGVTAGTPVMLDGSGSSDPEGDRLTFAWTLTSRPPGSLAGLTNASSPAALLTPDLPGEYRLSLTVSDGRAAGAPATMTLAVSAANSPPVALAMPAVRNVVTGSPVVLDGSASSDPDGDPLTFSWTLTRRPAGSNATLSAAATRTSVLAPDVEGIYVATLVAADGRSGSTSTSVIVQAFTGGTTPLTEETAHLRYLPLVMADAGPPQSIPAGTTVTLDGSASSDPQGSPLTYEWRLASVPPGSAATLINATSARATLLTDVAGQYRVFLRVSSDGTTSAYSETTISAQDLHRQTLPIPIGMPAWATEDWSAVATVAAPGKGLLRLYRTEADGELLAIPGRSTVLDFGPGTPGSKVVTINAGGARSVDIFATPPTWTGNEQAGRICWQTPGFDGRPSNLCHLPGTLDWTWDAYHGDEAGAYSWSTRAPDTASFPVLEAMRQGMAIDRLFAGTGASASLRMGADRFTIWTATLADIVNMIPLTSARSRPVSALSCSTWSFTPELFVTDGFQITCDMNDNYQFRWNVTRVMPMPASARRGARGAMGTGVVNVISLGPILWPRVMGSARIDWSWELRPDATAATALLCAIRSVHSRNSLLMTVLNTTRCFRVDRSGQVIGLQVEAFSPYVQPL